MVWDPVFLAAGSLLRTRTSSGGLIPEWQPFDERGKDLFDYGTLQIVFRCSSSVARLFCQIVFVINSSRRQLYGENVLYTVTQRLHL